MSAMSVAARLGVAPAAFWRLSLVEWRALAGGSAGVALSRTGLDALMRQHPDMSNDHE